MYKNNIVSLLLFWFALSLLLAGCSSVPVKHLNAEVALIKKGSTKAEVTAAMGKPTIINSADSAEEARQAGESESAVTAEDRQNLSRQNKEEEQWVYIVAKKSFWKRMWIYKYFLGSVSYEVVRITFVNNVIANYSFRYVTEEEFAKSALSAAYKNKS